MWNTKIHRTAGKLLVLHRDEGGAEMLEYILVVAVVALPMVGILIWFRDEITKWVRELWEDVRESDDVEPTLD